MNLNQQYSRLLPAAFVLLVAVSIGCEQQRYRPSVWKPASGGQNTLPGAGKLGGGQVAAVGSLPERNSGSLPYRMGSLPSRGGSLPMRIYGSLPMRGGSLPMRTGTLPNRPFIVAIPKAKNKKPPLPSRAGVIWDTRAKQDMGYAVGKRGLYNQNANPLLFRSSTSTLPSRFGGSGSTLPSRFGGSTLPSRMSGFGGSTLPNRFDSFGGSTLPSRFDSYDGFSTLPRR